MKKNKSIIAHSILVFIVTLGIVFITACGKPKIEAVSEETTDEPAMKSGTSSVTITQEQFASLDIQLGSIEQKNLSSVLKTTGNLRVPPENKANVTSIIGGTVRNILVNEGAKVNKGQTLLTLVNLEFVKMQQEYLDQAAQLTFSESDLARQKELSENNVTALKTYQQAESSYKSLKAKVSSLKNQLGLLNVNVNSLTAENISNVISISAPISGNISNIEVNIGASADAATHLMDIVDNSHLHLDVFVFEQDLPKIKISQLIDFTLTNLQGKHFTSTVFSIGAAFEGESKTIPVHAEITGDKKGLIEGMNVTAEINIGDNLTSAVLTNAIASNAGNDYIFIQEEKKEKDDKAEEFSYQRIQVKRGVTNGNFTEITSLTKIPENPKVVTNGAFYLLAMLTNEGEEE